ncbi:glyoxalase/bleomycin resistance/extradiol dioxygenase family protein [Carnobacterium divergens]|uniref:VOC family protein n=1 Tax=Carnobacterium divergens TaxID=2748 RepID=UPI000D4C55A8|nr:VOC family protein [Carnobacterium divergens]MCO6019196.1 VOC family protein [Carnobacterium divergens]TFI63518.1 glyoxalase/bleomycin resistance/extradiol dioxygenase family protein [Carnobacterium divergens]TFI90478.1 glyoxalase/bleomycin resistance/extradiol dioxygenase family protein [Carnobacterium divergens]TFJ05199.1 glyoxalase/bleomycin resistance/extradiol dioxygenase family protein [Carnobacterium divergens]TFJ06821.1 glyoxalase/bleomycin resistance/extradiol dioxygenase family pr
MITTLGQIMLYVEDQKAVAQFWIEKIGFVILAEEQVDNGFYWIEIAPTKEATTSIVLHNKAMIAKMQPELNLATPSLLFDSANLDETYRIFKEKGVTVGDLVTMPGRRVFNFSDNEGNYFAIQEK